MGYMLWASPRVCVNVDDLGIWMLEVCGALVGILRLESSAQTLKIILPSILGTSSQHWCCSLCSGSDCLLVGAVSWTFFPVAWSFLASLHCLLRSPSPAHMWISPRWLCILGIESDEVLLFCVNVCLALYSTYVDLFHRWLCNSSNGLKLIICRWWFARLLDQNHQLN